MNKYLFSLLKELITTAAVLFIIWMTIAKLESIDKKLDRQPKVLYINHHEYQFDVIDDVPDGTSIRIFDGDAGGTTFIGEVVIANTALDSLLRDGAKPTPPPEFHQPDEKLIKHFQ